VRCAADVAVWFLLCAALHGMQCAALWAFFFCDALRCAALHGMQCAALWSGFYVVDVGAMLLTMG
jgi:hypothetical protein